MTVQSKDVVANLNKFTEKLITTLGITLTSILEEDTPRATGFAATNWVPRIGLAFEGTAGTRPQAEAGLLDKGPQEAGLSLLALYKLPLIVNITNNVHYIKDLNNGTSKKAPAAFVQLGIVKSIVIVLSTIGS